MNKLNSLSLSLLSLPNSEYDNEINFIELFTSMPLGSPKGQNGFIMVHTTDENQWSLFSNLKHILVDKLMNDLGHEKPTFSFQNAVKVTHHEP